MPAIPASLPFDFLTGAEILQFEQLAYFDLGFAAIDGGIGEALRYTSFSQLIIHGTPYLSVSMAKRLAQKVSSRGICTVPLSARA